MQKIIEKMDEILRNTVLYNEDLFGGLLTEAFFNRKDISENKKEVLKKLNEQLKLELQK